MSKFTLSDVLATPALVSEPETRTFHSGGRDWTITISTDGKISAFVFQSLLERMQQAMGECGKVPNVKGTDGILVIAPTGKRIAVNSVSTLYPLYVLSDVATEPKFCIDEWVMFIDKMEPKTASEILGWVTAANGLDAFLMDQMANLGNVPSTEGGNSASSVPASKAFGKPRAKRSVA